MFQGLSAFPITPADENGRVCTTDLCALLERLVAANVQSIGLLGSTGTYAYLSRSQRRAAIEAAASYIQGKRPLIVGVGALRTDEAIALAQDAQKSGADALLLAPVSYTPLLNEEVYQHFKAVAGATELPLCIYNNPGTTHFYFKTDLLARLAQIPNIKAVKMPLPSNESIATNLNSLRDELPSQFCIGYSGDWGCPQAMLDGADAWYSVIAGILPHATLRLAQAATLGSSQETQSINQDFRPMWSLFKEFGGLRVVYTIAHLLDLTNANPPRPILPLDTSDQNRVIVALECLRVET